MRLRRRAGHLLVEALCALALGGVLIATAAVALSNVRRAMTASESVARARRTAREGASIAAAMLRDADAVTLLGDTAAHASFLVAISAACDIEASRRAVLLPPSEVSSGRPFTRRAQAIEAGDEVAVLASDSIGHGAAWISTVVDSVAIRTTSSPCGPLEGWTSGVDANAPRIRLALRDSLAASVRVGAPVRITRPGRLALYHAGSGDWMLGYRRCAVDGTCGASQPVAGSFVTPGRHGIAMRLDGPLLIVTARAAPDAIGDSAMVLPHSLRP